MQIEDLRKLVDKIQRLQCEMQIVELKSANKGCPTRLYDTLSSFANQDEGGVIVFGIDEGKGFEVVGVYDAQDDFFIIKENVKKCKSGMRKMKNV